MKSQTLVKVLGVFVLVFGAALALAAVGTTAAAGGGGGRAMTTPQAKGQATENNAAITDYKISGPYTHKNLAVFLIHGKDKLAGKSFLTLQEALRQRKVVVYETKNVNELAIQNLSRYEEVYVQSGDIVKGGQQDRMLGVDLIVPPRSGKISISAFCVEQGRWQKRGNEVATRFSSASERVATKELKLAANKAKSQGEVWKRVAEAQDKLSSNLGSSVNAPISNSSFQLTLENRQVQATADAYVRALARIADGQPDVIGYAFAINGKINSADVYAAGALFRKLWPSLLKASAVEAIAELQKGQKFDAVSAPDVRAFLADAETGAATETDVTKRVQMITRESKVNLLLETRDRSSGGAWLHRSYIKK
ncbi:MAG TPA: DUF6569 family protein [Pyrinomonadaceae bacterium]|nr:DUF6569 family protein [Pyrinomonadaceae bacterium]